MIFVVIGLTGSGKTNFINALTSSDDSGADSLTSETRSVIQRTVKHADGRRLIFLDTPGYDNIHLTDAGVLVLVDRYLETNYRSNTELGIIYFHRITDNRMKVPPPEYIDMLRNQCKSVTVGQICLVTTMWDDVHDKAGAEVRERILKEEFRKKNVCALFERFENHRSSTSAWDIANKLKGDGLREDLEDRERHFNEPQAGKGSYIRFQRLLSQRKEVVQRLVDQASAQGNLARVRELQAEHETLDAQLRLTLEEIREKNISLIRRALQRLKRGRTYGTRPSGR